MERQMNDITEMKYRNSRKDHLSRIIGLENKSSVSFVIGDSNKEVL